MPCPTLAPLLFLILHLSEVENSKRNQNFVVKEKQCADYRVDCVSLYFHSLSHLQPKRSHVKLTSLPCPSLKEKKEISERRATPEKSVKEGKRRYLKKHLVKRRTNRNNPVDKHTVIKVSLIPSFWRKPIR